MVVVLTLADLITIVSDVWLVFWVSWMHVTSSPSNSEGTDARPCLDTQTVALQMELANCMADCASTYEKQIPKLERDLMQSLQKRHR